MWKIGYAALVVSGLLLSPVAAGAQAVPGTSADADRPLEFPPEIVDEGPEMASGFHESLRMMTLWRLSEALAMDEDELVHFFPKFSAMEKTRQEYREEKTALLGEMEERMAAGETDRVAAAIEAYLETRDRFHERLRAQEDELLKGLTLEQRAQYLIFMETVAPEIEAMLRGFRRLR